MIKYKNPICAVWWVDAAYSFEESAPNKMPLGINIATGFVVDETEDYINLASNVIYNKDTSMITPSEGILIPNKMIVRFERIQDLSVYEKN